MEDKRYLERYQPLPDVEAELRYNSGEKKLTARASRIWDISNKGCCFKSENVENLRPGQRAKLNLKLNSKSLSEERDAKIERVWENGVAVSLEPAITAKKYCKTDIFVVHGHDEAAKESLARFIEKLDLKPIILHENPNEGRTIIEKFEEHSDVGFAVVLMTPDDVGASVDNKDNLEHRARQNVIFELGFFLGKLGRRKVCVLYKDVKIPSDCKGVLYIPMDKQGGWQLKLAKEINAAGIKVDLNKL